MLIGYLGDWIWSKARNDQIKLWELQETNIWLVQKVVLLTFIWLDTTVLSEIWNAPWRSTTSWILPLDRSGLSPNGYLNSLSTLATQVHRPRYINQKVLTIKRSIFQLLSVVEPLDASKLISRSAEPWDWALALSVSGISIVWLGNIYAYSPHSKLFPLPTCNISSVSFCFLKFYVLSCCQHTLREKGFGSLNRLHTCGVDGKFPSPPPLRRSIKWMIWPRYCGVHATSLGALSCYVDTLSLIFLYLLSTAAIMRSNCSLEIRPLSLVVTISLNLRVPLSNLVPKSKLFRRSLILELRGSGEKLRFRL
jgi:hypothetical protein